MCVVYIFALEPPCVCVCLLCTAGSELITALLEILIYPEPHRDTHTHQKACVCVCMCVCIPTLIGAKNRNKQRPEDLIEPANSTTTAPVRNQWPHLKVLIVFKQTRVKVLLQMNQLKTVQRQQNEPVEQNVDHLQLIFMLTSL